MAIKDHWSRMVRKSASSTSTMASNDSSSSTGGFLAKTFSWRASKTSTSTASISGSGWSNRGLGSNGSGSGGKSLKTTVTNVQPSANKHDIGSTIDCPLAGQSKKCNKLPPLEASAHHDNDYDDNDNDLSDDSGVRYRNMTESQRHQARLSAYTIKFGASQPWRSSFEDISPCNSRRASLDMGP